MRLTVNGVAYHVEQQGSGPAVFFLHGFTGSGDTWTPHLAALKAFTTVRIDFLGHGRCDAPADVQRYEMEACVSDVLALRERLGISRCAVVGYSMGGRVALRVALQAPERVWALVLESTSPGIADPTERRERATQDAMLARRIRNDGVAAFADYWQATPLFASQSRLPEPMRQALRAQRLQHTAHGLANSLQGLSAGMQEPVLRRLRNLHLPVLLLAGALDVKYCRLANEMAAVLPRSRVRIVPDAGHAVHLEQPAAFDDAVGGFLQAHVPVECEPLP
jgi:2-succinyl-6-hydroxy-2,4-cyclohexadiene-1-carboxylate synthase